MGDNKTRVPTEVNQVLQEISDPKLRVALRMLFIQNSTQHKENQIALGKFISEVQAAFPNKDFKGHHDAHATWIKGAVKVRNFIDDLFKTVLKLVGIAFILWCLYKLTGIKIG